MSGYKCNTFGYLMQRNSTFPLLFSTPLLIRYYFFPDFFNSFLALFLIFCSCSPTFISLAEGLSLGSLTIIEWMRLNCVVLVVYSVCVVHACECKCVFACVHLHICVYKTQKDQIHLPHENAVIQILAGTSYCSAAVITPVERRSINMVASPTFQYNCTFP